MKITKREKKNLFSKLVPAISRKLLKLKSEKYDFSEMRQLTGIGNNRLSEIAHYENYDKIVVNEKTIIQLLGGGLVKIEELLEKKNLTEEERAYLETLTIYEEKVNADDIRLLKKHGYSVNAAIREIIKLKKLA